MTPRQAPGRLWAPRTARIFLNRLYNGDRAAIRALLARRMAFLNRRGSERDRRFLRRLLREEPD